jgi:hypothetical protein
LAANHFGEKAEFQAIGIPHWLHAAVGLQHLFRQRSARFV